jgi:hypothetical protein
LLKGKVQETFSGTNFLVLCDLFFGLFLIPQRLFIVEANAWTHFEDDFIKK